MNGMKKMETRKTTIATFIISEGVKGLNIKSQRFNTYNKYEVPASELFSTMVELTDTFNNVLGLGIDFEVE